MQLDMGSRNINKHRNQRFLKELQQTKLRTGNKSLKKHLLGVGAYTSKSHENHTQNFGTGTSSKYRYAALFKATKGFFRVIHHYLTYTIS
jgi:hypothetical protein